MILSPFARLFKSLARTRKSISGFLGRIVAGDMSEDKMEALESLLLTADMGVKTAQETLEWFEQREVGEDIRDELKEYLQPMLGNDAGIEDLQRDLPAAVLIVGVNGTGKTTTAAKLAYFLKTSGHRVLLIGADTYRAAAVEQLDGWCTVAGVDMVCNETSRDPSAVMFDGLQAARARDRTHAIIDTAGRLHTSGNLMREVEKMSRVASTKFPEFRLITYLTLDANLGQNSLTQASTFNEHVSIDGIILTKLDGTAKGGIIFPIWRELNIPVKFLGVGETLHDLVKFDSGEYVSSLLGASEQQSTR